MVYHLLNSFEPEYAKSYLKNALIHDENALWFLGSFINVSTDVSRKMEKEYEVHNADTEYFSVEQSLKAIESCRKDDTFFKFPKELQHKCAAFFLVNSGNPNYGRRVHQNDTENLISSWK